MFCQGLGGPRALVNIEIMPPLRSVSFANQNHDIAPSQGRSELRADIGIESRPVHGALKGPGYDKLIMAQAHDEGLSPPFAEWCLGIQTLSPRTAPLERVMLVFTLVSSMKTSLSGIRRMKGWQCLRHCCRAAYTSVRSFSDASSGFFIGEPFLTQKLGQVRRINRHPMGGLKPRGQDRHRDVRLGPQPDKSWFIVLCQLFVLLLTVVGALRRGQENSVSAPVR